MIARRNIRRLKTVDCALIAIYDLATIGLFALIGMFFLNTLNKAAFFLRRLVLSSEIMASNRAITKMNISLFEQATMTFLGGILAIVIVGSIIYALLNYLQWNKVSKQKLSKRQAIQYVCFQSSCILGFITVILLSYYFLLDTSRIGYSIPIYLILVAHLIMGSHIGLLRKGLRFHWKKIPDFVIKVFSPCFDKLWTWTIVYGLFFLILFLDLVILGVFIDLGPLGYSLAGAFSLASLAWWRMTSYDLLTD